VLLDERPRIHSHWPQDRAHDRCLPVKLEPDQLGVAEVQAHRADADLEALSGPGPLIRDFSIGCIVGSIASPFSSALLVCTALHASSNEASPVRDAVRKTRDSVVTVKVVKKSSNDVVGTGVVIDERGYIITNRHVVKGATKLTVQFFDKTEYTAKIDMMDASHDLAVLKISSEKKLKALRLGPTRDLEVGESIIAIGAPYGFNDTVFTGIISNLGRSLTLPDGTEVGNLIQHSAPIDPTPAVRCSTWTAN
jgi:S1-C subfamily serine protease